MPQESSMNRQRTILLLAALAASAALAFEAMRWAHDAYRTRRAEVKPLKTSVVRVGPPPEDPASTAPGEPAPGEPAPSGEQDEGDAGRQPTQPAMPEGAVVPEEPVSVPSHD